MSVSRTRPLISRLHDRMKEECTLCRIVDERRGAQRPLYDTHLLETPTFVVIPAVGPVRPGHVMVVSRSHIPNLASMAPTGSQSTMSWYGWSHAALPIA